jgi:hypothetical protein
MIFLPLPQGERKIENPATAYLILGNKMTDAPVPGLLA